MTKNFLTLIFRSTGFRGGEGQREGSYFSSDNIFQFLPAKDSEKTIKDSFEMMKQINIRHSAEIFGGPKFGPRVHLKILKQMLRSDELSTKIRPSPIN